jgi:hypothetical protein
LFTKRVRQARLSLLIGNSCFASVAMTILDSVQSTDASTFLALSTGNSEALSKDLGVMIQRVVQCAIAML